MENRIVSEFESSAATEATHSDASTSAVVGMIGCFAALFLMLAA